jgi:hypothetical protein
MPHATAPAYNNVARNRSAPTHTPAQANNRQGRANRSLANANANNRSSRAAGTTAQGQSHHVAGSSTRASVAGNSGSGRVSPATKASANALASLSSSSSPYRYTYGSGTGARPYRAYGYGRGYRNRYYGAGYGYGRSQGLNRGIVSRLRSVHASLARVDHDYQGHRARAMHSVSMAIRQLSNRSMIYTGAGFAAGMNNRAAMGQGMGVGQGMGMRRSGLGGGGRGGQRMTQAQSDARMSQALRSLQGIGMQLSNQGYNTIGHGRAMGHIQQAIHELNTALSIR